MMWSRCMRALSLPRSSSGILSRCINGKHGPVFVPPEPVPRKLREELFSRNGNPDSSSLNELRLSRLGDIQQTKHRPRNRTSTGFVDQITIRVSAGNGGPGVVAFSRGPNAEMVPPDGGNGGAGGGIWLKADAEVSSLHMPLQHIRAESGAPGAGALRHGRSGTDSVVRVPPGTVVRLADVKDTPILCDLSVDGATALVARGGLGGRGNASYKSSTNRSPNYAQSGTSGEVLRLDLELKSIADVGLVGIPNAGKSTLLRAISRARPKVASYPFTTLRPHIGVVEELGSVGKDPRRITVADIPGLIEGAHNNKGLGHEFLRHIERTSVLVYVIDMSCGSQGREPLDLLLRELELYEPGLTRRPGCIAANKMDVGMKSVDALRSLLHEVGDSINVFPISAQDASGTSELAQYLIEVVRPEADKLEQDVPHERAAS